MTHEHGHHGDHAAGRPPFGRVDAVVFTAERLVEEFGASSGRALSADHHRQVLDEQVAIVEHQWRNEIRRGLVRGFFLSGPPGVGKSTLARRLVYELSHRFPRERGRDGVVGIFLDGAEVARSKYGDTERRIQEIFAAAGAGLGTPGQRTVIVFDDVESLFLARGGEYAKEWHFSQDAVFFHAIDALDTSTTTVVLTSNRPDLVDPAVRDRFLGYAVPPPSVESLVAVATARCTEAGMGADAAAALAVSLRAAAKSGQAVSLRDAEHFAARFYLERVLGRRSLAH